MAASGVPYCATPAALMARLLIGVPLLRRLAAFDNVRQVQVAGLLVHRPSSATEMQAPESRSK